MKNREIISWTIAIALIGGAILFISLSKNQSYVDIKNISTSQTPAPASSTTGSITVDNITQTRSYALSDVSKHNNQTNCWVVISGNIYDITSFISSHPAGMQKILQGCGIDATNLYDRVGAHNISKLSAFIVGTLK